ncbi:hypothetical protein HFP89_02525 [Wenzhouxiangella sp. XN79A]|uniref:hypothetical protein n=1 Tax=Wenzhouxiangella sp. XN79A TaxID=2724193 RepID=UPI00144AD78B|nr:hypothetical protein [Wenzhouxiangella sp. XN79A]NKI34041.1 hypothetical protein [Wenzhouxiangella sp. XN79A]
MWPPTDRLAALLLVAALLAGCAGPPDPAPPVARPGTDALVDALAERLTGVYTGSAPGDAMAGVRLQVRPQSAPGTRPARIELIQHAGDGPARRFVLALVASPAVPGQLVGVFSPLDAAGRPRGECPLTGSARDGGVVLTTSAATCRFGAGDGEVGLIKEFAFDGRRLVIGDRVLGANGESALPDSLIEFLPVHRYTGWAGRRDDGAGEGSWRRADAVALASDGRSVALVDAGGMPLGVELELAPYWPDENAAVLLRLRAFDADSGELLGQVWADPDATRLGLGLGDFQAGLERAED